MRQLHATGKLTCSSVPKPCLYVFVALCSQYATNATVVSEYIRALVLTGKLNQYTAAQTLIPGADGSVLAPGEDHRSLYQLLKDLQAKVSPEQGTKLRHTQTHRHTHARC